jgi:hypothetical protein
MKAAGIGPTKMARRLTKRLGRPVHQSDVSRWCKRERKPTHEAAVALCDELAIPAGPTKLRLLVIGYREAPGIEDDVEKREESSRAMTQMS